jgi:hypothetical protein
VLDPRKRIWGDVMSVIVAATCAAEHAVAELARRPRDRAALEQAALTREAFERAVEIGRQWTLDEAVLAEHWQRAFDEGIAAERARRCRLEVIPGGH